jgi:hypothetical protein
LFAHHASTWCRERISCRHIAACRQACGAKHNTLMRTTLDIDDPVLKEIKRLQRREGKSLGRLVSDLLMQALSQHRTEPAEEPAFQWVTRPMESRIDLSDGASLHDAMDRSAR